MIIPAYNEEQDNYRTNTYNRYTDCLLFTKTTRQKETAIFAGNKRLTTNINENYESL